jgi:spoIIIJ-associated protein
VTDQTTEQSQADEPMEGIEAAPVGDEPTPARDEPTPADDGRLDPLTAEGEEEPAVEAARPSRVELLEQEGEIAADYLEELLDIADLDGDLDIDVEGDRAAVSIVGAELRQLVGRSGEVLEALQELTRLAVYRETGERSRLMLDISGYRAEKRSALEKLAAATVLEVQKSGERATLEAMTPFERKVVHDAVGLRSASEGEEPHRRVVILPAG